MTRTPNAVEAVQAIIEHNFDEMRPRPFGLRSAEAFTSKNANLQQYLSWTDDQQERYHEEAERANADWVEKKLRELNALWLIVIDGQIVAHGPALRTFPHEEEFDALCEKLGKYPLVVFSPLMFLIEEAVTQLNN